MAANAILEGKGAKTADTFGLMPLGALPMGYAIDAIGPTATMIIMGSVLMGVSLLMYLFANSLRKLS